MVRLGLLAYVCLQAMPEAIGSSRVYSVNTSLYLDYYLADSVSSPDPTRWNHASPRLSWDGIVGQVRSYRYIGDDGVP